MPDNNTINEMRSLLREWVETHDEPCRFDHHGLCQSHYLEEGADCIVARTQALLDKAEAPPLEHRNVVVGSVWMHTKTRRIYKVTAIVYNTVTDVQDVLYVANEEKDWPPSEVFTRQLKDHPKAFISINEDGNERFKLVSKP